MEKFKHSELDLDILINEKGAGSRGGIKIKGLGINAQPLRFLSLLEGHVIQHTYKGLEIRIPNPCAFVLHKILIYDRRKNPLKKVKDMRSAVGLGEFLMKRDFERKEYLEIFSSLPEKWKQKILKNIKPYSDILFSHLHKTF